MPEGPFDAYVAAARAGELWVEMDPKGFDEMDAELEAFKDGVRAMATDFGKLGERTKYGLGEDHPRLTSAKAIVEAYRQTASGGTDSAEATLKTYWQGADQMQQMFKDMRRNYEAADQQNADNLSNTMQPPEGK